jgi:hypothetical protein
MVEMIGEWIELHRSKGVEISVATVGTLYDFSHWLETQSTEHSVEPTVSQIRIPYQDVNSAHFIFVRE